MRSNFTSTHKGPLLSVDELQIKLRSPSFRAEIMEMLLQVSQDIPWPPLRKVHPEFHWLQLGVAILKLGRMCRHEREFQGEDRPELASISWGRSRQSSSRQFEQYFPLKSWGEIFWSLRMLMNCWLIYEITKYVTISNLMVGKISSTSFDRENGW